MNYIYIQRDLRNAIWEEVSKEWTNYITYDKIKPTRALKCVLGTYFTCKVDLYDELTHSYRTEYVILHKKGVNKRFIICDIVNIDQIKETK